MKAYEGIFILRPDLNDAEKEKVVSHIVDLIKKNQGEVKSQNEWGKRPLSYKIKKFNEALYYQIDFLAEPGSIAELKKQYGLSDQILKVLIAKA